MTLQRTIFSQPTKHSSPSSPPSNFAAGRWLLWLLNFVFFFVVLFLTILLFSGLFLKHCMDARGWGERGGGHPLLWFFSRIFVWNYISHFCCSSEILFIVTFSFLQNPVTPDCYLPNPSGLYIPFASFAPTRLWGITYDILINTLLPMFDDTPFPEPRRGPSLDPQVCVIYMYVVRDR